MTEQEGEADLWNPVYQQELEALCATYAYGMTVNYDEQGFLAPETPAQEKEHMKLALELSAQQHLVASVQDRVMATKPSFLPEYTDMETISARDLGVDRLDKEAVEKKFLPMVGDKVANAMKNGAAVRKLDFKDCTITADGAEAMSVTLKHTLAGVQYVNFTSILDQSDSEDGPKVISSLCDSVRGAPHLRHIVMDKQALGPKGSAAVAGLLFSGPQRRTMSYSEDDLMELPEFISEEIEKRKDPETRKASPPPAACVHGVRAYFLDGADPMVEGGFVDLMEGLGAPIDSKDPLVQNPKYNCWYYGDPNDESNSGSPRRVEREHASRVRLLRYGEFIDRQARRGLDHEDRFSFPAREEQQERIVITPTEDDLTDHQLRMLSLCFVNGLYHYANHERFHKGSAEGAQLERLVQVNGSNVRFQKFDVTLSLLLAQCKELVNRYDEQGRPLFPPSSWPGREAAPVPADHASRIQGHVKLLMQALEKCLDPPTRASAELLIFMGKMLHSAARADPDITKSFCDTSRDEGATVVRIRDAALRNGRHADDPCTGIAEDTADAWWVCYNIYTSLLGKLCVLSVGPEENYPKWFKERDSKCRCSNDMVSDFVDLVALPALMESVCSQSSAVREPALEALADMVVVCREKQVYRLVKDKKIWKIFEDASLAAECVEISRRGSEKKTKTGDDRRERMSIVPASANATFLIFRICQRGMTGDDECVNPVAPTSLAKKIVERGAVPTLVRLAQSLHDRVAVSAVEGLAQISRVKDCRTILFQDRAGGIDLMRKLLSSSDGYRVSPAFLLGLHLLWDEEWRDPLMSMRPPIEETAVKWASYAMHLIRERAFEQRREEKIQLEKIIQSRGYRARDPLERELELQVNEMTLSRKKETSWKEMEEGEQEGFILSRSLILLSTMALHPDAPDRLRRADALNLAAACLDVPTYDTHMGASHLLHNYGAATNNEIVPSLFWDPPHVVRAITGHIQKYIGEQRNGMRLAVLVSFLSVLSKKPEWKSIFNAVAEDSHHLWFLMDPAFQRFGDSPSPSLNRSSAKTTASKPKEKFAKAAASAEDDPSRASLSSACGDLTGKLLTCNFCGKMEGKKGDFRRCGRCAIALYCNRECQKKAWKAHKKECRRPPVATGNKK